MADPAPGAPFHPPFHDLGGQPAGPLVREEHGVTFFEKRIDAMLMLLTDTRRRLIRVDEHRRTMEQFGPELYWKLSYYERWLHSITSLMLEKGILTRDELDARMAEIRSRRNSSG
jgi:hypothetical protein